MPVKCREERSAGLQWLLVLTHQFMAINQWLDWLKSGKPKISFCSAMHHDKVPKLCMLELSETWIFFALL